MSDDGDLGDMEEVGHSSVEFFDHHDPSKPEKIEVSIKKAVEGWNLIALHLTVRYWARHSKFHLNKMP